MRQFCERQGYRATRTDHYRYDKVLPDGSVSRTMVSFGRDAEQVPAGLWTRVWKHQLRLADEEQFWSGLNGAPVRYDIAPIPQSLPPLPEHLQRFLRDTLHYTEAQIGATSRDAAQELLNAHYARELNPPP